MNENEEPNAAKQPPEPPRRVRPVAERPFHEEPLDDEVEPARFPAGFWASVDYMLHHPDEIRKSLKTGTDVAGLSRVFFTISLVMLALYGMVMGATNFLQGSAMPLGGKLVMIPVTGVKVPVLFLLTLLIVFPPVYVSNAFVGKRFPFFSLLASLLASLAVTSTVLASMATVAFFFSLTSKSYHFIKLLHVLFFAYAGLSGLGYLRRHVRLVGRSAGTGASGRLAVLWLALYIFVGTQLAWVLRPFVGTPGEPFQLFRPRQGNFYESVYHSLGELADKGLDD